jgi:hypothetical protein
MSLADAINDALGICADVADQATEMADNLAGAETALEDRDPELRRAEAQACVELLDELESNTRTLRTLLKRVAT